MAGAESVGADLQRGQTCPRRAQDSMNIQIGASSKKKRKRKEAVGAFNSDETLAPAASAKKAEKIIPVEKVVADESSSGMRSKGVPETVVERTNSKRGVSQVLQTLLTKNVKNQQFKSEKERFLHDLTSCPNEIDTNDTECFEGMPVEDFGMAMLRGMGWSPEKDPSVGNEAKTSSTPCLRPARLGLGAVPLGSVPSDADQGSSDPMPVPSTQPPETLEPVIPPCWLALDIRVRVNTNEVANGSYYAEKGVISSVDSSLKMCSVVMDKDGVCVERVRESWLNSALPKPGGSVLILRGRDRGAAGILLKRDKREKMAFVRLATGSDPQQFHYDDVAEFLSTR